MSSRDEPMDDQPDGIASDEQPCPICGERAYTFGRLEGSLNIFIREGEPLWKRWFFPFFSMRDGMRGIRARKCDHCGNVQMFAK